MNDTQPPAPTSSDEHELRTQHRRNLELALAPYIGQAAVTGTLALTVAKNIREGLDMLLANEQRHPVLTEADALADLGGYPRPDYPTLL